MTPTQTVLFVFLGSIALLSFAHADDSPDITLHNDGILDETNLVTNWTLVCEHLCSLNLSGPACGLDCPSTSAPVNDPDDLSDSSERYNFPPEHRSELCETLCDNGLGGSHCDCPTLIVAASSGFKDTDRLKICHDFCRYHAVTLRGCKKCPFAQKNVKLPKEYFGFFPSSSSSESPPSKQQRLDSVKVKPYVAPFNILYDGNIQSTAATPTTPDWSKICATLCRLGTGGILCNCDLAPF